MVKKNDNFYICYSPVVLHLSRLILGLVEMAVTYDLLASDDGNGGPWPW